MPSIQVQSFFYSMCKSIMEHYNCVGQMIRTGLRLLSRYSSLHKPPSNVPPQDEDQEDTALIQKEIVKRRAELEALHQRTQALIDKELKFPLKLCGTRDKFENRYSYMPQRVMSYYRIPKNSITDYLLKMYKASLYAIADSNKAYMDEYWEKSLTEEVLKVMEKAQQEYTIKVMEDHYFLDDDQETCEIVDALMIRGLSMNREQNEAPSSYVRFAEHSEVGLVTYTPKHITENNERFIDPKQNKNVYEGYEKMMMRVLVRIKSPLKINIKEFDINSQIDTSEHLCIMENQMVAPKHLESSYKLETLMEWLGKYRFGPWKVVDIDNFMRGNSPFAKHVTEEDELDEVFKGTKLDKSSYIDIRTF